MTPLTLIFTSVLFGQIQGFEQTISKDNPVSIDLEKSKATNNSNLKDNINLDEQSFNETTTHSALDTKTMAFLDKKRMEVHENSSGKELGGNALDHNKQLKRNGEFYAFIKKKLHYDEGLQNHLVDVVSSNKEFNKNDHEVVSLKGMTDNFIAMLNKAHESESLEDPFQLLSLYNNGKNNNNIFTDSSSFVVIPQNVENKVTFHTTTATPFESSSQSFNTTTTRPDSIVGTESIIPMPSEHIHESNSAASNFESSALGVPIYEEISSSLHIDSSIDDVIEHSVGEETTENTDEYIPTFNTSRKNILDPELSIGSNNVSYSFDLSGKKLNYTTNMTLEETVGSRQFDASRTPNISLGNGQANYFSFFTYNNVGSENETPNRILEASKRHDNLIITAQAERILEVMNTSVDPCDDFYEYACGKWADVYPLENKALDNTFDRLREGLDEVLKSLLETPFAPGDSNSSKLAKTLYRGCMNADQIESVGSKPLQIILQELGGWPVLEGDFWNGIDFDWVEQMARLRSYNNDILLSEWVAADITNSSRYVVQLDQPDLGLPSREYFLSRRDQQYRDAYLTLMLDACKILEANPFIAVRDMVHVLDFETRLAKILTPSEERKNLSAVHRRITINQLQVEIPEIPWKRYLSSISGEYYESIDEVIIFSMEYIKKLVSLIQKSDRRTVSNYLLWRFVKNRISNLGREALQAKQEFIQVLFGSKSQPDRWLACVSYVNGNLGHTVGSMFVQKYYPKSSKNDSEDIIRLIRESFAEVLQSSEWLEKQTRQIAVEKVEAMVRNVGYPEYILNDTHMDNIYVELNFDEGEHFWNVIKMLQFHAKSTHKLLTRVVDREEWTTTPAVVNAYYSRSKNMIMFPAGLLQPPFYHPAFPKCLNFGGVGVVIGHEISHGFDDRGRQFDLNGNLHQWWTANDVENFYKRATCMLIQYGDYKIESVNVNINSVNTLSENIADNIGVKIAYKAYQKWKNTNKDESLKMSIANLNNDQLFFLNFGQIWCEVNSPKAILTKLRGGQHSPNKYRVIGTLSNSPEFSETFKCPIGSPMNPEEKCTVW